MLVLREREIERERERERVRKRESECVVVCHTQCLLAGTLQSCSHLVPYLSRPPPPIMSPPGTLLWVLPTGACV